MTVWTKSVSWSKFKLALTCPRQLQYVIDKTPISVTGSDYYAWLGKVVQFVFEQYFNQQVNIKSNGSREVFDKVVAKLLDGPWFDKLKINYGFTQKEDDLKKAVRAHCEKGYDIFKRMKVLTRKVDCETDWNATFRNFRMFGKMDFVVPMGGSQVILLDGKGNSKEDADPRQLLYYALILMASGRDVVGGGFVYWQHEFRKVDLSPSAIKHFVDTDFQRGVAVFRKLREGVDLLPAVPSAENCYYCDWKGSCISSHFRKEMVEAGTAEVQFLPVDALLKGASS
jgi:CRISPR/Cas system-associated exonuclease Cas4 (RecB family)